MESLLQSAKEVLKQMKENDDMISRILDEAQFIKQQSHTFQFSRPKDDKQRVIDALESKKASYSYLDYMNRNYNTVAVLDSFKKNVDSEGIKEEFKIKSEVDEENKVPTKINNEVRKLYNKVLSTGDNPEDSNFIINNLISEIEIAKNQSNGLKQENENLLKQNEALTRLLEEQQNALNIVMKKYREHVMILMEKNKTLEQQQFDLQSAINNDEIYTEKNKIIDKQNQQIDDMINVMINAINTDIQAQSNTDIMMDQLTSENQILRNILELKQKTASFIYKSNNQDIEK